MTAQPAPSGFSVDARSRRLAAALQIEVALREAETLEQVLFVAVNELERVVSYDTAVAWLARRGKAVVAAVTAVSEVDAQSAFAAELQTLADRLVCAGAAGETRDIARGDEAKFPWPDGLPERALSIPLGKARSGGLLLFRAAPFQPAETMVVEHLAAAAAFSAERFLARRRSLSRLLSTKNGFVALIVMACLAFIPVCLTVLAPAEVIAVAPVTLAPPMPGSSGRFSRRPTPT